ncbi:uncharacterized protein MONBRDRAFT_22373 [Monosiga brevicollis MX1]|uniref:Cytochrome c oxidase assembly protein COX20, mitochondrial n=1 Tax=Monosiga brevicollis TaxID=81824 RepID=A9UQE1_MONBE|nr:uncharacterized protein MONBRDRAFT_22373 [Monosiga brevicollis MX1]EDQ93029.1 predicted protein [Monosiga brevicollis MX1]|eukprot:XP_001742791.1 hypothetical protein [Monosiga brevicollis MX1]
MASARAACACVVASPHSHASWPRMQRLQTPCLKESFAQGAMMGATVGAIRFVRSKYIVSALKWGTATFMLSTMAALEFCRYNRQASESRLDKTVAAMNEYNRAKAGKQLPYPHDRDVTSK